MLRQDSYMDEFSNISHNTLSSVPTLDDIILEANNSIGISPTNNSGDKTRLLLSILQNRKNNMYDKETRRVLYNEKVIAGTEVKRHTQGYIIVPRDQWENISAGSHILYMGLDDKHRSGGYVKFKSEKNGKWFFQLETKPGKRMNDPGYVSFPVLFENIKILYKKIDPAASVEINMIKKDLAAKREQLDTVHKQLQIARQERIELEERLIAIEQDNIKIKSLLKRLMGGNK